MPVTDQYAVTRDSVGADAEERLRQGTTSSLRTGCPVPGYGEAP
jgi:hypothetical protein